MITRRPTILTLGSAFLIAAYLLASPGKDPPAAGSQPEPEEGGSVPLIRVIANPKDYEGKRITVEGWLRVRGGADVSVVPTREHASRHEAFDAINLEGPWIRNLIDKTSEATFKPVIGALNGEEVQVGGVFGKAPGPVAGSIDVQNLLFYDLADKHTLQDEIGEAYPKKTKSEEKK